ncbi:MAG TPA: ribbon-helix-helix domain-containing protein [Azospirillum sp.]
MPKPHTVLIGHSKTSVSLETEFWNALDDIAKAEGSTKRALILRVHDLSGDANLTAALRVFVIAYWRAIACASPVVEATARKAMPMALNAVQGWWREETDNKERRRARRSTARA